MSEVKIHRIDDKKAYFIPSQYLPAGKDSDYLRNEQIGGVRSKKWRNLQSSEIEVLIKNGVTCSDWDSILVSNPFSPHLIKNTQFVGLVRIGALEDVELEHHDLKAPAGITNSLVISCDFGDNVAVHDVRHISHFIVGNHVMLLSINEMCTTNYAKFGNGITKEGEPEENRIWLDLMNEAGGRGVLPFDGIRTADAWLWAKYRADTSLQNQLKKMTQQEFDPRRGFFGEVGNSTVIKNSRILKDVKIGDGCYIKGANKLKNLTIKSSFAEPTQIGEGVELVNGIVGLGSRIFYGCKAVRFITGNNTVLKYGARLIHSFLGDNSVVSCCELLNNLIFPAHEQHHNNSFLVASVIMGQSNIAAGATIGSNHNSRANDGEIQAGRGFWPGLCTTLKHSSRFASFTLIAKGNYPAELDIRLPFSLISNSEARNELHIRPAFWWLHNMYALIRNTWKYRQRDKRKSNAQNIEFDALAPDSVEEIVSGMSLLEEWAGQTHEQSSARKTNETTTDWGRRLLTEDVEIGELEIYATGVENTNRKAVVYKSREGYQAYREMLLYYAVTNILDHLESEPSATASRFLGNPSEPRETEWVNLGGQLMTVSDRDQLTDQIKSGGLKNWSAVHAEYDRLWAGYPLTKRRHAAAILIELSGNTTFTENDWNGALDEAMRIQEVINERVFLTRKKDFENPFRQATFESPAEMKAVVGDAQSNEFVGWVRQETIAFKNRVSKYRRRWQAVD